MKYQVRIEQGEAGASSLDLAVSIAKHLTETISTRAELVRIDGINQETAIAAYENGEEVDRSN